MPPEADGEAYQSFSLLAAAALALAIIYAVTISVGTLVALYQRAPLLVPLWTFLLPAAALLLCWVARAQIQRSEGTLIGLSLTRWGVALSLVFGLCYAMYYTATAMAVRQQANDFARKWLEELRKGEVDRAFWLTLKPPRSGFKRQALEESQINSPEFTSPNTLSGFHLLDFVRLLRESGTTAAIELRGVERWSYEKGGHQVSLLYQITSPIADCSVLVTVHGIEVREKESEGRQWYVMMDGTGLPKPEVRVDAPQPVVYQKRGQELLRVMPGAGKAASDFLDNIRQGHLLAAFAATLPPADRKRLSTPSSRLRLVAQGEVAQVALGLVPLPLDGVRPEDVKRWSAFQKGDLIRPAEPDGFWTAKAETRERAIGELKDLFAPGERPRYRFDIKTAMSPNAKVPLWRQAGSRWHLRFDFQLGFLSIHDFGGPLLVEVRVPVTADVTPLINPAEINWQVEGIELVRARVMSSQRR
jgi:hypothetical protein